jgi:hypothetical protein
MAVVQYHGVVVETLAADALRLFWDAGPQVHMGGVKPNEEGFTIRMSLLDELDSAFGCIVIDGLHALLGQRTGVLDASIGEGVDHAAGSEALTEGRVLRVIGMFRLIFSI